MNKITVWDILINIHDRILIEGPGIHSTGYYPPQYLPSPIPEPNLRTVLGTPPLSDPCLYLNYCVAKTQFECIYSILPVPPPPPADEVASPYPIPTPPAGRSLPVYVPRLAYG